MKNVNILLVEDNEGDILLTTEAFEECKSIKKINIIKDGASAIDFLIKNLINLPDLILLDINLPKKNGHEVLSFIKKNKKLNHIPVIMLTTSSSDVDIHSSYKNHANCYLTKPIDVGEFFNLIKKIEEFWIKLVTFP